jgi:hypothetical protein
MSTAATSFAPSATVWIMDLLDRDDVGLLSTSPAARQRVTVRDCIVRGAVRCLVFMAERHGWAPEDWPRASAFGPYPTLASSACTAAAAGGHLAMLKLLRDHECEWDEDTCVRAAAGGRLDCLRFALDRGCPCNVATCAAAAAGGRGGDINCLRLLLDRFPLGCAATPGAEETVVAAAAGEGRLAFLHLLHARGWKWNASACSAAALGGFTCCLDFLLSCDCPCDETAVEHAAMAGAMACLVLAVERGAPTSLAAAEAAARNGNEDCLQYLLFRLTEKMRRQYSRPCAIAAAEGGRVECLSLLMMYADRAAVDWDWEVMERRASPQSDAKTWIATARQMLLSSSATTAAF